MSDVFVPPTHRIVIKGEEVTVHDPSLHKVLAMLRDAKGVFAKLVNLKQLGDSEDVFGNLVDIMADPEIFAGFCCCASACTDKPTEFYAPYANGEGGITLSEAAQLIDAMRTAVNWEVLKELFRRVVPTMGLGTTNSPSLPPVLTLSDV